MDARPPDGSFPRKHDSLLHALAGLQAGIVGVFWMFGCFITAALWNGRSVWSVPNLFSTAFYGDDAYDAEFLRSTWAGIAIILVLYGLLGAVWGWWWKYERKPLLWLFGALTGLVTYYFFFHFVWPWADPLIPLYAPLPQLQVAHVLWGMALARSPGYSRRIAEANANVVATNAGQSESVNIGNQTEEPDDAESASGELIL